MGESHHPPPSQVGIVALQCRAEPGHEGCFPALTVPISTLCLKIHLYERQHYREREAETERRLPAAGLCLTWLQWPGRAQVKP